MKPIYLDSEFCCHTSNLNGTYRAVETDFFDGKCDAFIEGHRFVPAGQSWVREDGTEFRGPMVAPWKDDRILQAYQEQYEAMAPSTEVLEKAAAYDILMKGESA